MRDGRLAAVIDWGAAGLNAMWGYVPSSVAGLYREAVASPSRRLIASLDVG